MVPPSIVGLGIVQGRRQDRLVQCSVRLSLGSLSSGSFVGSKRGCPLSVRSPGSLALRGGQTHFQAVSLNSGSNISPLDLKASSIPHPHSAPLNLKMNPRSGILGNSLFNCVGGKEGISSPELHFRFGGCAEPGPCSRTWQSHGMGHRVPRNRPEAEVDFKLSLKG